MPAPTDFSSAEYWSTRFENEISFEWLISDEKLISFIQENLGISNQTEDEKINILHFGSGTSSLGPSLQRHLTKNGKNVQVHDSDYVPTPGSTSTANPEEGRDIQPGIPFILMDVMDLKSLKSNSPEQKWDYMIDKSTCDAISCSPNTTLDIEDNQGEVDSIILEPVRKLLYNLSSVIKRGGRWLSISYSSNRFENSNITVSPVELEFGWTLIKKQMISTTYIPGGKRVKDPKTGEERIVYEPETGVWLYVLDKV